MMLSPNLRLSRFNNGLNASSRLLINYISARHPKFQVQVDGWGSAHDKKHSLY